MRVSGGQVQIDPIIVVVSDRAFAFVDALFVSTEMDVRVTSLEQIRRIRPA